MATKAKHPIKDNYIEHNLWSYLKNKEFWSLVTNATIIACIITPPFIYFAFSWNILENAFIVLLNKYGDIWTNAIIIFGIFLLSLIGEFIYFRIKGIRK